MSGSSPHTRGAPGCWGGACGSGRIIPAYAGSTQRMQSSGSAPWDHPRIRGEHRWRWPIGPGPGGSSPHTRGAPPPEDLLQYNNGIIPAYAGSTGGGGRSGRDRADHPRIRGEHLPRRICSNTIMGSSPHTRGALRARYPRACRWRIIPAYAGSTVEVAGREPFGGGSSPHTRGAPPHRRNRAPPRLDHPRIRGEHHGF